MYEELSRIVQKNCKEVLLATLQGFYAANIK